jgi:predicted O-methyltransferase YrrM
VGSREHELADVARPAQLYGADRFQGVSAESPRLWINRGFNMRRAPDEEVMYEANGVKGFLTDADGDFLFRHAKQCPPNAVIAELGSFMGLSSVIFANGLIRTRNLNGRIYCVDTWRGSKEHTEREEVKQDTLYDIFLRNVREAGVAGFIHPLRMPSVEAARKFRDGSLDLLFIDADHSEAACLADLEAWYPKVRPGGVILGHDCYEDNGVRRAVNAFTATRQLSYEAPRYLRFFIIKPGIA